MKWSCPCPGCLKARKKTFEDILDILYENNDYSYNMWRIKQLYIEEFGKKK